MGISPHRLIGRLGRRHGTVESAGSQLGVRVHKVEHALHGLGFAKGGPVAQIQRRLDSIPGAIHGFGAEVETGVGEHSDDGPRRRVLDDSGPERPPPGKARQPGRQQAALLNICCQAVTHVENVHPVCQPGSLEEKAGFCDVLPTCEDDRLETDAEIVAALCCPRLSGMGGYVQDNGLDLIIALASEGRNSPL